MFKTSYTQEAVKVIAAEFVKFTESNMQSVILKSEGPETNIRDTASFKDFITDIYPTHMRNNFYKSIVNLTDDEVKDKLVAFVDKYYLTYDQFQLYAGHWNTEQAKRVRDIIALNKLA